MTKSYRLKSVLV